MQENVKYSDWTEERLARYADSLESGDWDQDADDVLILVRMLQDARRQLAAAAPTAHEEGE